jgi:DNA-directed RNA polymerase subunit RPC12/RpoP
MQDFITLSCPSCGYKLQIKKDVDRFVCADCGKEYIVNRGGGIVNLKPVEDDLATADDNIILRMLSDLRNDIKQGNITPQQLDGYMEILNNFKREMEDISEEEGKKRKGE